MREEACEFAAIACLDISAFATKIRIIDAARDSDDPLIEWTSKKILIKRLLAGFAPDAWKGERCLQKSEKRARGRPVGSSDQERKRQEFVAAVMRAIAENGYKDLTVSTICEAAGFSRGLIGHYFPGKDALLLHAVREVATDFEHATRTAAAEAGADPLDRLHAVVAATFREPVFAPERVLVWVALASTSHWSPELAEIYRNLYRPYRRGLARLIKRAADARRLDVNCERLAITLTQLVEGLWSGWAADPKTVSAREAEAACHDLLDAFLPTP